MKSKIILLCTIVLSFLLQTTVVKKMAIGSIAPNLLVILCISMGLMRGRKSGLWVGFFSGMLVDLFYGSFLGFYALIYMYVGFFSGYAYRICYDDEIKVPVMLSVGGDMILTFVVYRIYYFINYHFMEPVRPERESIWVLK